MLPWLESCLAQGISEAPVARLVTMLTCPSTVNFLKNELSTYIFVCTPLRRITYYLEGDGQLVFVTHRVIKENFLDRFPGGIIPTQPVRKEVYVGGGGVLKKVEV